MKTLNDILITRNEKYNTVTDNIINDYREKFTAILSLLIKEDDVAVTWFELDFLANSPEFIKIMGKIVPKIGERILDSITHTYIDITNKNKTMYLKYVNLVLDVDKLETLSIADIVADILQVNKKIDVIEQDINKLPISPTKH